MVYSIRSGDHRIGSFILHKADFCAGDIILGNFDFSGASTRCLQVRNGGVFFCSVFSNSRVCSTPCCRPAKERIRWLVRWLSALLCFFGAQHTDESQRGSTHVRACLALRSASLQRRQFRNTAIASVVGIENQLGLTLDLPRSYALLRCARAWRCARKTRTPSAGAGRRRRLGGRRCRGGAGRAPVTSALSIPARFVCKKQLSFCFFSRA